MFAFRAIRSGGFDDAGRAMELSREVAGSMAAVLSACRWGAAMIGLAWAAPTAAAGDLPLVATLAVAVFLASWRTFRPIRLGDGNQFQTAVAINDVAILSAAIGWSDGLANPFVGSVLVAIAVVSFGWGLRAGIGAATTALVVTVAVDTVVNGVALGPQPSRLARRRRRRHLPRRRSVPAAPHGGSSAEDEPRSLAPARYESVAFAS